MTIASQHLVERNDEEYNRILILKSRYHRAKNLTLLAKSYLPPPIFLVLTLAKSATYKPTEITGLKFPNNTVVSPFRRTVLYLPTGSSLIVQGSLQGKEE